MKNRFFCFLATLAVLLLLCSASACGQAVTDSSPSWLLDFRTLEELKAYLGEHDDWQVKRHDLPEREAKLAESGILVPNFTILSSVFHASLEGGFTLSVGAGKAVSCRVVQPEEYAVTETVSGFDSPMRTGSIEFGYFLKDPAGWKPEDDYDPEVWTEQNGCYVRPGAGSDWLEEAISYDICWEQAYGTVQVTGMPATFMDAFWENRENLMEWVSVD